MEFATGALGTLLPKLVQLLQDEYNLQKGVKKDIEFISKELESVHAALRDVGEVPQDQLKEVVKIWARDVRELSYDMEDIVDTFLVRIQGSEPPSKRSVKRFIKKMTNIVSKATTRHEIGQEMKDIKQRVKDVAERRDRYNVDAVTPIRTSVDPRITALYTKAANLVGVDEPREELISKLTKEDGGMSSTERRVVSIAGFGGLGKTTLAKAVYDKLKPQFDCTAFISVSRDPNIIRVLKDILYELDKNEHKDIHNTELGQQHLIELVHEFLKNERYLIVIDDIWDTEPWEIIRCALPENGLKSRIITTTRIIYVAEHVGGCYKMKPLSDHKSKILFYGRIFGSESDCPKQLSEVSENILKKCGGVPLAIVTTSSLLSNKSRNANQWQDVCDSIGSGLGNNPGLPHPLPLPHGHTHDSSTCIIAAPLSPPGSRGPPHLLHWYLLILDDVWNKDVDKWEKLKACLKQGGIGSAILTTTRDKEIAGFMGTIANNDLWKNRYHDVSLLDKEFIHEIIKTRAFSLRQTKSKELVKLVGPMAERCVGSPLAARALGSVLRNKTTKEEWEDILHRSRICDDENLILPILNLSYKDMPNDMKQCFAFCAMYPKDYQIDVDELIQLWMANGYISDQNRVPAETMGKRIVSELVSRSFFQYKEQRTIGYSSTTSVKIHDLMHDVALSASENECVCLTIGFFESGELLPSAARHILFQERTDTNFVPSSIRERFPPLQTMIFDRSYYHRQHLPHSSKFGSLRALSLPRLSDFSIKPKHLCHLRYLDLSHNCEIEALPDDISILYCLQTLLAVEDSKDFLSK